MSRVILHIGTLKTGTTSFQRWFSDNEEAITTTTGVRWFRGQFPDAREIAAICVDEGRPTPAMALGFFPSRDSSEWVSWAQTVRENVRSQTAASDAPLFVSCEALCLLRTRSELARLTELFDPSETELVLTLRSPAGFLSSWKQHLDHDFFRRSNDRSSFAYVRNDSWLVDYDNLCAVYRAAYGDRLKIIDYDDVVTRDGSVIPSLIATFTDHNPDDLPDWSTYMLNRSARPPRQPIKGLARPRHYYRWWRWRASQKLRRLASR